MDIASVIVTFVLTCRVLTRSILDSRRDPRAFCLSRATHADVSFFLFNRFRTFTPSCSGLLQKPGGGHIPPSRKRTAHSSRGCCRPVVVSLESRCISTGNARYLFSLHIVTGLFPSKRGGVHPLPSCPLLFPTNLHSVAPCLCGYPSPLPRRELVGDLCYSSSPQRSFQPCFLLVVLSHFPSQ